MKLKQKQVKNLQPPLIPIIGLLLIIGAAKLVPDVVLGRGCDADVTVEFDCKGFTVNSSKDVSHVVVHLYQSHSYKLDNLAGNEFSHSDDDIIESITVKSGCTIKHFKNDACDVLPVSWGSISLAGNTLSWQTLSEVNNSHFIIYGSNGASFLPLDSVPGNGTDLDGENYILHLGGHYDYVMIKQVDYDDGYEYSKVVSNKTKRIRYKQEEIYDILRRKVR